ncbi:FHA domain-containing protein [Nocardia nepalensis]|uniref:FHA domain-containing protein n=1 Tax=Nocardia nepalensis TaxID=3375448 RepID=UPI003B670923
MYRLQFQAASLAWTFDEDRVLRIGRSQDADIQLDAPGVSRIHAELRPTAVGWDLHDNASSQGTWVNEQRVEHITLGPSTAVRFGMGADGVEATITIDLPTADEPTKRTPYLEATRVYISGESATGQPGPGMLIRTRDGDTQIEWGSTVRIGREPDLDVVADHPAVSRQHAVVEARPDGWWLLDRSTSGSFIDGERIVEKKITTPTQVYLGHPTAGYELTLVPLVDVAAAQKLFAAKRRRRILVRGAAVLGVLVLALGVAAVFLLSGRAPEPTTLTASRLDRAKRASVEIIAAEQDGVPLWRGSGTLISSDGLILTNVHVGHPSAPGSPEQSDEAPMYLIALTKDDASPAETKYRATTIVSDGYLDLAVMKINAKADGSALDGGQLELPEPLPIGNSDALHTGDHITALGYPSLTSGRAVTGPLTVTSGDVSSFMSDPVTHTDRFWIDSTERLASGNSGGASINNAGELIGINSAVVTAETSGGRLGEFTSGSSLIRPVALGADIIRIARKGGDPKYVSPYLDKLPHLDAKATVRSAGWGKSSSEGCEGASTEDHPQTLTGIAVGDVIYAKFEVTGIPDATPFVIAFIADDKRTVLFQAESTWKLGEAKQCVEQNLEIPRGIKGADAILIVGPQNEVRVVNPVRFG